MKTINVTFEDEEYQDLMVIKKPSESWRDFILRMSDVKKKGG